MLMDFTALKKYISLCFVSVIIAGCAANHVVLDDPTSWTSEIVVREIGYDNKGLPILGAALVGRPSKSGDRFSGAYSGYRPVISYELP
jgi:hypothetical protein